MLEFFEALDISDEEAIDDIQFKSFLKETTDCSDADADAMFDMFDVDASGQIEFDEFFLLICMLIALKDREEKQFLFYHSRTCFELIDADGSQQISTTEFVRFGFLFNLSKSAINQIFDDFDVSGDRELDYDEFRLFTIAAIDRQRQIDEKNLIANPEKPLRESLDSRLSQTQSPVKVKGKRRGKPAKLTASSSSPIRRSGSRHIRAGHADPLDTAERGMRASKNRALLDGRGAPAGAGLGEDERQEKEKGKSPGQLAQIGEAKGEEKPGKCMVS